MTIPSVLKTTGSSSGQAAAVAVSSVAAIISTAVRRHRPSRLLDLQRDPDPGGDNRDDGDPCHPAMGMIKHGDRSAREGQQGGGQGEGQDAAGRAGDRRQRGDRCRCGDLAAGLVWRGAAAARRIL